MLKIVRRAKQVFTAGLSLSVLYTTSCVILLAVSRFCSDTGPPLPAGLCHLQWVPPLMGMVAHPPRLHGDNSHHFRVPVHEE